MAKKALNKGFFITFEGCEGCGKSTHSRLLYDYLERLGYGCVITREPGGTRAGEEIRKILLHSDGIKISDVTELFLFESARAQIVRQIIRPALDKKRIVICDRFSDATLAYQGYGARIPALTIKALDKVATGGIMPDLTFVLDIDVLTGLGRAKRKGYDRMEKKALSYHRRVRTGYLAIAAKEPARVKIVNLEDDISGTQSNIRRQVSRVIQRYKR
ncbi:MAG: dTMP kinase [Candidatus Omnitrophica bacterium]|nr:dTMP kinase [Candidatus Omnitrophota bacterium]